jgi:DNA polymerase III sliding clamp (beta) subunit (PCNA family)
VLLQPKPVGAYLGSIDPVKELRLEVTTAGDVSVKTGKANPYLFRPVAATFPQPPAPTEGQMAFDGSRLGLALGTVRAAVSKDYNGVQLVSRDGKLLLHSTDLFRVSSAELPEAFFGEFTGLVPLSTLDRVSKLDLDHVTVDHLARVLSFTGGNITVTSRLLAVPFPTVDTVLDNFPPFSCKMRTENVLAALDRLFAIAETEPLTVKLSGSVMTLTARNIDLGSGAEEVELMTPVADEFEFKVKLPYLRDSIASPGPEIITLSYSGPFTALFFTGDTPLSFTHVVMPVRG